MLTPFIRPVEVRNITLGGEWLYSLFSGRTRMCLQKVTSLGISISFTLLWMFLFAKRNLSILYKNLSIFFAPPEQPWLKFSIPQRVRAVQTVLCSLIQDCLCWVQIKPRNKIPLDPCQWDQMLTLAIRTGFCRSVMETVCCLMSQVWSGGSCSL